MKIDRFEGLIKLNLKIIELGRKHNKPVVATCDAHYIDEEDQIYRRILMAGQGYKDLGEGGLYFRTTDEMFEAFDYLDGPVKCVCAPNTPVPFATNLEQAYIPDADKVLKVADELIQDLKG